ncbi:MAG TPA: SPOR domain-containing protein [Croceibacterium sp.]
MALPDNGRGGEAPGDYDDDGIDGEEQLTLADAEERLPWLESDDDYEQPGVDTGRIVAFAAVGLLFVVLLLGGLWWLTREPSEDVAVADGSTIEAPDEPYKTRPEDRGGRQVEGTGDTSFEVAEGQSVEGRIDSGGVPAPSIDREQTAAPTQTPSAPATTSAPAGSIGVQVGAYSTRAQAETGWNQLSGRFEVLKGRSHRVLQGTADSGTVFRLQALAGTVAEAEMLCRGIRAQGGDCQVKR